MGRANRRAAPLSLRNNASIIARKTFNLELARDLHSLTPAPIQRGQIAVSP
jgi:hypothetical protein